MKVLVSAAAAAFLLSLAGCNTVAGVGKDVSKVGEKTTEAAGKVSDDLKKDAPKK